MDSRSPDDLPGGDVRERLRRALREALRTRDMTAVRALRSALGAIDNAEAAPLGVGPDVIATNSHVAGTVAGLGAGEAQRRRLTDQQLCEIVRVEIAERQDAASEYERAGHAGQADRLRREVQVLMSAISDNGHP